MFDQDSAEPEYILYICHAFFFLIYVQLNWLLMRPGIVRTLRTLRLTTNFPSSGPINFFSKKKKKMEKMPTSIIRACCLNFRRKKLLVIKSYACGPLATM